MKSIAIDPWARRPISAASMPNGDLRSLPRLKKVER